jgi:hypothetical protein
LKKFPVYFPVSRELKNTAGLNFEGNRNQLQLANSNASPLTKRRSG